MACLFGPCVFDAERRRKGKDDDKMSACLSGDGEYRDECVCTFHNSTYFSAVLEQN